MRTCLDLAERGGGFVHPNPMVGAVLVKDGRVTGQGWHRRSGGPHAEIECLRSAVEDPAGGTLYVNLEPCSHFGKTPPCTDALIRAGVRRVVIAMGDPNPLVKGRGVKKLRSAGVDVSSGLMKEEAAYLNRQFVTHIRSGRPYIHVKVAQSLDGKIAGGPNRWITSRAARELVHHWRARYDAVLVGAGTVRADRPSLTVRHSEGRHPHIVVLDGALSLTDTDLRFPRRNERRVIVCTTHRAVLRRRRTVRRLGRNGVEVLAVTGGHGKVPLGGILEALYHHGISSVLVEGGAEVFGQFAVSGLVDEWSVFVAPTLIGPGKEAFPGYQGERGKKGQPPIRTMVWRAVGSDLLIRAYAHVYHPAVIGAGSEFI
jgi:diaminohydroxyphosphoribosylaminopyrimidine deaminase/5-amino-6-(5-phosphoribosylamino)uracil reductase